MQETISLFTEKYGLTRSEVIAKIEKVFSEVFSRRYGFEVMVVLQPDDHLEAVAYNKVDVVAVESNRIAFSNQALYVVIMTDQFLKH